MAETLTKTQASLRLLENIATSGRVYSDRTPLIDTLVRNGWVAATPDAKSRRYDITAAGREVLEAMRA